MALTNFPASMAGRQDSRYYAMVRENKAITTKTEGGYVLSRPRTTRSARRIFTTGFTDISQAEYETLEAFFEEVGTFTEFNWINPTTDESIEVRITKPPTAKYAGIGGNHRYNISDLEFRET